MQPAVASTGQGRTRPRPLGPPAPRPWDFLERHRLSLGVMAAAGLAVALRAPWFSVPLGNDEAGLAFIAGHSHGGGPNVFGFYFIDRPPLLLGVFHLAVETGGTAAVRTIGALACVLMVVLVALIARELGGNRAALWAAFIAAFLGSSPALASVFTPAELLAVLPSAGSVLVLLVAQRMPGRTRLCCFALAGFLALSAVLVKQSFGDALLAGGVCLAAGLLTERGARRRWVHAAFAYLAGIAVAVLALELWERIYGVPDGAVSYALLDFRLEGLDTLSTSAGALTDRLLDRLLAPLAASGLLLVLLTSIVGIRRLAPRRVVQVTVIAWAAGGAAGVLLGGSYWNHYLIELIPVAAGTSALALAVAPRRVAEVAAGVCMVAASLGFVLVPGGSEAAGSADTARSVGTYVGDRADAGDSIYVLYSQPNITYYSGLRSPYPYEWSLMVRTVPHAERRLRTLFASDRRPTWVVRWETPSSYGLDASGRTAELLRDHYRRVGAVCGVPVLLREHARRPAAGALPSCG